jgi:hypothetical protein
MNDLGTCAALWLSAKEDERSANERRRHLENQMLSLIGIPETLEGTDISHAPGGYTIKIVGRIDRKVDSDLAREIADEYGLQNHLNNLFRWRAELNFKEWKNSDPEITGPFLAAITSKPGRPSFSITKSEE